MTGTADEVKSRVVDYYVATTQASYLENWSGESLGFHVGIADETTTSQAESLNNTNAFLAARAGVGRGTRVLDAGCGVGGSSLWLAKEKGARVSGVTLVPEQVELARKFARERGLEELADFACEDMLATSFPEATFDVVWNLESMCHVVDLDAYLAHASFLLEDGGCLVVVDFCRGPRPDPECEALVCNGWALAPLRPAPDVIRALERHGFERVESEELFPRVERSLQALEAMASRSLLKMRAEKAFMGVAPAPLYEAHVRAALACVEGMRSGAVSLTHFLAHRSARA